MTARRWRSIAAVLLLAAAVPTLLRSQPRAVTRSFKTWGQYLGGADSSQYSALDQINRRNVSRLEVADGQRHERPLWQRPCACLAAHA